MAVNVYYGFSSTPSATAEKVVSIKNPAITEDLSLDKGDILVVYFQFKNTAAAPQLRISNTDIGGNVSVSDDNGKFVKTNDVHVEYTELWGDGETVCFVYTPHPSQTNEVSSWYWEILDARRASTVLYGPTKLVDDFGQLNAAEWLQYEGEEDDDLAVTPGLIKKLMNALLSGVEEEEGEIPIDPEDPDSGSGTDPAVILGLIWEPAIRDDESDVLGHISLSIEGQKTEIDYPLTKQVNSIIDNQITEIRNELVSLIPEYTSQLKNNGPGPTPEDPNPSMQPDVGAHPFIYNLYPDPITISGPLNGDNTKPLVIDGKQYNVIIQPNLQVTGDITATNAHTNTIQNSGSLVNGGTISAGSNVSAPVFIEDSTSLINKYSTKLVTQWWTTSAITIGAGKSASHYKLPVGKTNCVPIGIIGWNLSYRGSDDTDAQYCSLWESFLMPDSISSGHGTIQYAIKNFRSKQVVVEVQYCVLYATVWPTASVDVTNQNQEPTSE